MDNINQPLAPLPTKPEPKEQNIYTWLKTLSIGFSLVSFGIALAIVGYVLGAR